MAQATKLFRDSRGLLEQPAPSASNHNQRRRAECIVDGLFSIPAQINVRIDFEWDCSSEFPDSPAHEA